MFSLDPFYPILPDTEWLARLLPQGIRLVQLRIKDQPQNVVSAEIAKAVALCRTHRCELVVNDYWQEAIAQRASFVHLGQEDLARADVRAIKSAGIRLGVSTHSDTELKAALAANPDYVALGPIYATTLKAMPWAPQGLLRHCRMAREDRLPARRHRRHQPGPGSARTRCRRRLGRRHHRYNDGRRS